MQDREAKAGAHKCGSGNNSAINVQSCDTPTLNEDKGPAGARCHLPATQGIGMQRS